MTDLQLTEFLIDTVETLLCIVREQNAKLAEVDAVIAADRIQEVSDRYTATVYPQPHQRGGDVT
ncbi:MAG: hypothetical protein LUG55_07980 [Clostridiales bacterium]|nr:hypothetical protein [Clostridiales bacterium]